MSNVIRAKVEIQSFEALLRIRSVIVGGCTFRMIVGLQGAQLHSLQREGKGAMKESK